MPLTDDDKRWIASQLQNLPTKGDLESLKTELIGEDAKLLHEIRGFVRDRISGYHPEERLSK